MVAHLLLHLLLISPMVFYREKERRRTRRRIKYNFDIKHTFWWRNAFSFLTFCKILLLILLGVFAAAAAPPPIKSVSHKKWLEGMNDKAPQSTTHQNPTHLSFFCLSCWFWCTSPLTPHASTSVRRISYFAHPLRAYHLESWPCKQPFSWAVL